jgi:hypothetical protein
MRNGITRDLLLVSLTALACFVVAVPLTSGATARSERHITVRPGNVVNFAGLDWSCVYPPAGSLSGKAFAFFAPNGTGLICNRDSTGSGVSQYLSGEKMRVYQCLPNGKCRTLLRHARNP